MHVKRSNDVFALDEKVNKTTFKTELPNDPRELVRQTRLKIKIKSVKINGHRYPVKAREIAEVFGRKHVMKLPPPTDNVAKGLNPKT